MHTFLITSTGAGVGLTSVSLGLVGSLLRHGLNVGFFKPVAQNYQSDDGPERSSKLVERTHGLASPEPLAMAHVERKLGDGELDELLEEIISLFHQVAIDKDVMIVEGVVPTHQASYAERVNLHLAKSLNAEVILVAAQEGEEPPALADRMEIQAQAFSDPKNPTIIGVILNGVRSSDGPKAYVERLREQAPLFKTDGFRILGCIPWNEALNAPRTRDVAELLGATVLHAGDFERRRMKSVALLARSVAHTVDLLKPGVLVVTPGDRDDIIIAVGLAALNGVPLAGLLLTNSHVPNQKIIELCQGALRSGLPVLSVATASYDTANNLNRLNKEIPIDDRDRARMVSGYIASHLDHHWLSQRCGTQREARMTPAAFRYQLVKRAKQAHKRIVLPEGDEPRTVQAAAICHARGIAQCVLLAKPEKVHDVAQAHGIELPDGLEILDPDLVRARYIAPMMALRKGKNLPAPMAEKQLEDNVVLGTMMLALDEVDGLVSGAIHTTANTIRPALQLIKMAHGYSLVSSIFFMLLPDQVLVYGDCAVNPDPTAAELAEIALQSAASAAAFGIVPRVAMISYSTGDSGGGEGVEKVREATRIARSRNPDLAIDGPLQYDAAAIESVGKQKAPNSEVAGHATVYIFPDLNTGNTTYKAVQRSADCVSVGPMLQGLRKPVNDLSRGALVDDIVFTIALTVIQAANLQPA